MSISYNQMDEGLRPLAPSPTEYERRAEKARKEMEDVIDWSERQKSLSRHGSLKEKEDVSDWSERQKSLSRHGSLKEKAKHSPPRSKPEEAEGEEECQEPGGGSGKGWWTCTEKAFLNQKPDAALEDESTNTQFDSYSYSPQYAVAGHVPAYVKKSTPAADVAAH